MTITVNPDDEKYLAEYNKGFDFSAANAGVLDLSQLPIEIAVQQIDQYPNEAYALIRKDGLGGSDASSVLGVSPYTTRQQLVEEKCRDHLTKDEKAIGLKDSVRKGADLEPMVISKVAEILGKRIIKPVDMYAMKDFPWLKINYDGIVDKEFTEGDKYVYIPAEMKVCTTFGFKHYDFKKAWFQEGIGFLSMPENFGLSTMNTIQTKAAQYGIPPYYYTQVQQQIMGANAPFGYLCVIFERDWRVYIFVIWRDDVVIQNLIIESNKVWELIRRGRKPDFEMKLQDHIAKAIAAPVVEVPPYGTE
jgi:predicted phage-related endonuclease